MCAEVQCLLHYDHLSLDGIEMSKQDSGRGTGGFGSTRESISSATTTSNSSEWKTFTRGSVEIHKSLYLDKLCKMDDTIVYCKVNKNESGQYTIYLQSE